MVKERPSVTPVIRYLTLLAVYHVLLFKTDAQTAELQWCHYRLYNNPRSWADARAICEQQNMTLAHITDSEQHEYLTSLIKTSLPAVYGGRQTNEQLWLGLYQTAGAQPVWQDNCETIRDDYSPVPASIGASEKCFVLDVENTYYGWDDCYATKEFICQSNVTDLETCFTPTSTIINASPENTKYAGLHPIDCFPYCNGANCVGFLIKGKDCTPITFKPDNSFTLGGTDKYVKALMVTNFIEITGQQHIFSSICDPHEIYSSVVTEPFTSHQPPPMIVGPGTEYTPEATTTTVFSSYPASVSFSTSSFVTPPLTTSFAINSPRDITTPRYITTPDSTSASLNMTSQLNVMLYEIGTMKSVSSDDINFFSSQLLYYIQSNFGETCSNLDKIIEVESEIINKAEMLTPGNRNIRETINSFLLIMNIIYGYNVGQKGCQEDLQQMDEMMMEDNILKSSKLLLKWTNSNTNQYSFEHTGTSLKIVLENGANIQESYTTAFGTLMFQHLLTLKRQMNDKRIMIMREDEDTFPYKEF